MSDSESEKQKEDAGSGSSRKEPEGVSGDTLRKSGRVLFADRIEIYPDRPLPVYNVGQNKAYKAALQGKGTSGLIAIVCEHQWVPRLDAAFKYFKISNANLATLVDHGVVYWPPATQERYVFFYVDNWYEPLLSEDAPAAMGWKPEDVRESVLKPFIHILEDFRNYDFVHGAIRPTNMFGALNGAGASGAPKHVILGDCLSVPASFTQPCLYEPIERAMADPIARGIGTRADDLYSFGISLAVMMRVVDPLRGLSDEEIIRKKIEVGSYAAVTGKDRFKGEILELLRGLLHDDPEQRWTLEEIAVWLDGRRLSPKQSLVRKKAPRPLSFLGGKFFLLPVLAMALDKSALETKRIVEDDTLLQWLQRSLDDEEMTERVEKAVGGAKDAGSGDGYQDRLVMHLSAALDSFAPLRYQGLHMMGDGMGAAMVEAVVLKKNIKPFADIIMYGLMSVWLGFHENSDVDITGLFTRSEHCRRFIRNQRIGEGPERCLYVLCPQSPCLSDKFDSFFVTEPKDILRAFEALCQSGRAPVTFIDRHVAAFLMERDLKLIESRLFDLNSGIRSKVILANLRCLADIQKRYEVGPVPGVLKAFSGVMDDVYALYHDRRVRERFRKEVDALVSKGDLVKLTALLTDIDLLAKDEQKFERAVREYTQLCAEAEDLEERLENKDSFALDIGRKWMAFISATLSVLVMMGSALSLFVGRSFF